MPCQHICWPDGHHHSTYANTNTLATIAIARFTTVAHIASIALLSGFATPCPSPLALKDPLRLISSLLPMRMFHFSCSSSLFTDNFGPHLLSQT